MKIYDKKRLKQVIYGFQLRTTAIIINGLANSVQKNVILNEMKKELNALKLDKQYLNLLWNNCVKRYYQLVKSTYVQLNGKKSKILLSKDEQKRLKNIRQFPLVSSKNQKKPSKIHLISALPNNTKVLLDKRKNELYEQLARSVLEELEREKNALANSIEEQNKKQQLQEMITPSRASNKIDGLPIFFLCSSHINPAQDHEDWEGKVYISQDWKSRAYEQGGTELVKKVRSYIHNHHTRTIEWVTGAPVYLLFRPNCKHYFIALSTQETLGSSTRTLLRKHNMYMQDKPPLSYAETVLKKYYEKLKTLEQLYSLSPSPRLAEDIKKCRRLFRKWRATVLSEKNKTKTK